MLARSPGLPLLAVLSVLAGCVTTPLGTARTLPAGELQHQVGLGVSPLPEAEFACANECGGGVMFVPTASWTLRQGVADGVEAGIGAHTLGLHGDLKLALHRSDAGAVAIAPTVGGGVGPVASGALPVLVDLELGPAATLTLAVTPTHLIGGDDFEESWTLVGVGGGLTWRAASWLALQPGLHWMLPLRSERDLSGAPLIFAGLGVALGTHAAP